MDYANFLKQCGEIVGEKYVLDTFSDMQPYVTDCRKRFVGKAAAVILPSNVKEVSQIVALCNRFQVPIVPQGGNTGTVLGSVPDKLGNAVVLSLKRLNRIREIDADNNTLTVEAGCILDHIHEAAADINRIFPLTLASSGSCTIGGNLATNAGGTAVLRYGTARDLCLGIEAVLPDGSILNGLYKLRKNNTGYDLRNLMIGSEGTLGIITAAVLKVFQSPSYKQTAFVAVNTPTDALSLLNVAQKHADTLLTTFELISKDSLQVVLKHFPELIPPLSIESAYYVLMELNGGNSEEYLNQTLESILSGAFESNIVTDASIAQSIAQSKNMWALRENISAAQAREGKNIKHDISVPISSLPSFIEETDALLQLAFPGCRMTTFGHLGDGSLHYNVGAPTGIPDDDFLSKQDAVNQVVYDSVANYHGAISAEHGLGALKHDKNACYKDDVEIRLMKQIKMALDPNNILNPGKVIP